MAQQRYPDYEMPFAHEIPEEWIHFADLREEFLLDYCYNTARCYWTDLDEWFWWAVQRNKDPLNLTEKDQKQYYALLRRRKYSENTIRRRRVVLGLFYRVRDQGESNKCERDPLQE